MSRRIGLLAAGAVAAFLCAVAPASAARADQASTDSVVVAFPATPPTEEGDPALPCAPGDIFCAGGAVFDWVGGEVAELAGDALIVFMTAVWEAGLWVLGLAFSVIDSLTTPDLSADGPLSQVYPITFGLGAAVAILMALVQVGLAAFRRDGQSIGRIAVGVCQFGLVWAGYVGVAALLVTGVGGLTTGLLQGLLDIDSFASFQTTVSGPREITDIVTATILGASSFLLLIPASAAYLLLMMVREAALMVLAATSAISAGGLLAESSRAWFWKSLRWFVAALLISPAAVLILGIGVKMTEGVVSGYGDETASAVGMAVVGCLLILLGAIAPITLFKLLAFVDPGTSSGTAMRQSLAASGGVMGLLSGATGSGRAGQVVSGSGSGASTKIQGGRAAGESSAEGSTQGRFAGAVRALSAASEKAGGLAGGVASAGADVLGGAGVGHQAHYYGHQSSPRGGATPGGGGSAGTDQPDYWPAPPDHEPPAAPPPAFPLPQPAPPEPAAPLHGPAPWPSPSGSPDPARPVRAPEPAAAATTRPPSRPVWNGEATQSWAATDPRTGGVRR